MSDLGSIAGRIEIEYQDAVQGLERVRDAIKQLESSGGSVPGLTSIGNQIKSLEDRADAFEKKWRGVGLAFLGTGGLIAGGAGLATAAFVGFEQRMANVNSIAHLSTSELAAVSDEVLALSAASGQMPTTLADSLYDIYSSGFQGADAMNILTVSTNAANAGLTDTTTAAKATTAVLNAYNLSADQAGRVSDVLFQTVNDGVVTYEQLAANMGNVLPIANALGIPIEELAAGYAVMTKNGISAAESETALAAIMRSAVNPTTAMQEAVEAYGYSSAEALIQAEGLPGFLKFLEQASGGSAEGLSELLGSSEATTAALALMAENGDQYAAALLNMMGASEGAGATQEALAEQSKSLGYQLQRLKAMFAVLAIGVGEAIAPFVRFGVDALQGLISFLTELPPGIKNVVLAITGFVGILSGLVGGFILAYPIALRFAAGLLKLTQVVPGLARALSILRFAIMGLLTANPVVLAIVAVLAALAVAYKTNFLGFADAVNHVVGVVVDGFNKALAGIKNFVDVFTTNFEILNRQGGALPAVFFALGAAIQSIGGGIPIFQKIGKGVSAFGNRLKTLTDVFKRARKAGSDPFGAGMAALTAAFPELRGLVIALTPAITRFRDAFKAALDSGLNPVHAAFKALGAAIPILAGFIDHMIAQWAHLRDALQSVGQAIKAAFEGDWDAVWSNLGDAALSVVKAIGESFLALGTLIRDVFIAIDWGAVGATAGRLIIAGLRGLAGLAGDAFGAMIEAIEGRFPRLAGVFDAIRFAASLLFETISGVVDVIGDVVGAAIDFATSEAAINAYKAVWNGLQTAVGAVLGIISTVAGYVFDFATSEGAIKTYKAIWDGLKTSVGAVLGIIATVAGFVFDFATSEGAVNTYKAVWDGLKTSVGAVLGIISTVAGFVFDFATSEEAVRTYQAIWDGLSTTIGAVVDSITSVVDFVIDFTTSETAIDTYRAVWNQLDNVISRIIDTIKGVVDFVIDFTTSETAVNTYKGVWSGLKTVIDGIKGAVEAASNAVPDFSAITGAIDAVMSKIQAGIDLWNQFLGLFGGGGEKGPSTSVGDVQLPTTNPNNEPNQPDATNQPPEGAVPVEPTIGPPVIDSGPIKAWTQAVAAARVQAVGLKADTTASFAGMKAAHDANVAPITATLQSTPSRWGAPVQAAMTGIRTSIGTQLAAAQAGLQTSFAAMSGAAIGQSSAMNAGVSGQARGMSSTVRAQAQAMQSGASASASGMRSSVSGSASGMSSSVQSHAGSMRAGVASQTSAMASAAIGNSQRAASGSVQAIAGATGSIRNAASAWSGAVAAQAGAMGAAGRSAGAAASNGVAAGIRGALGAAKAAASELAAVVANAAALKLAISSPSKVMARLGHWAVDGLVMPLKRRLSEVMAASSELGLAVKSGLSGALNGVYGNSPMLATALPAMIEPAYGMMAPASTSTSSMTQTNYFDIKSTDPHAAAREVAALLVSSTQRTQGPWR